MHVRFTGPIARLAAAAALSAFLLPAFAGTAAAATSKTPTVAVGLTSQSITLPAKFTGSTETTMAGQVNLTAGVMYSWTFGFFNTAKATTKATVTVPAEQILAKEITPVGGAYTWACTLDPDPTTSTYTSSCELNGANDGYVYALDQFTVPAPSMKFDWQVSFVATSRVRGKTQTKAPSYASDQCTYGAEREIHATYGVHPRQWHNAMLWFANANKGGWSTSWYPQSNSVVVFQPGVDAAGSAGHVAWVNGIEFRSDGIYLHTTEMNLPNTTKGSYHHRILRDTGAKTTTPAMGYILPI
jgi:surface antigen